MRRCSCHFADTGYRCAIAAVIAIGVLLYKNWDKIKEFAETLEGIKSGWSDMVEGSRIIQWIGEFFVGYGIGNRMRLQQYRMVQVCQNGLQPVGNFVTAVGTG